MRLFLNILSLRLFSRIYGRIVRIKNPRFIIKRVIKFFAKKYNISMADYQGDFEDYKSLSDFFIRKLDTNKRLLKKSSFHILSPSDSLLSALELIYENKATQIKGINYDIDALIGKKLDYEKGYYVLTFYLSPHDYHRFHSPITAKIKSYYHTGTRLFPVNKMGLKNIKSLFVKNERIVFEMEFKNTDLYFVSVGATFVGSIKFDFIKDYKTKNKWVDINYKVFQLDELGRFEMGSTIVLIVEKSIVDSVLIKEGTRVKVGEPLIKLIN